VWVIAPDADSLQRRWQALIDAPAERKQLLFHPTLRAGVPADRHIDSALQSSLPGHPGSLTPLLQESAPCLLPVRFAARSFDRQWIIPDVRVITQPNGLLWNSLSTAQIYVTALIDRHPGAGPALTLAPSPPDKHHFKGSFGGKVFPLWLDAAATRSNVRRPFLLALGERLGRTVAADEFLAYLAGVAGHAGFVRRFDNDLAAPGLRIPITASVELFDEATNLGRRVAWLQTFGERFVDVSAGRDPGDPRLPTGRRPQVPKGGAIPSTPEGMPNFLDYDAEKQRLIVGSGLQRAADRGVRTAHAGRLLPRRPCAGDGTRPAVAWPRTRRGRRGGLMHARRPLPCGMMRA
jgi:hypothetical protein